MTRPRRYAKFEKMTLMLTEANAAFLRTWAESQGITINEFVRRILCLGRGAEVQPATGEQGTRQPQVRGRHGMGEQ